MNVLQKILLALVFIGLLQAEEVAHYKLDGNALDSSKYERHGVMLGDAQGTFDRHGHQNKALLFGANERVDTPFYYGGSVIVDKFKEVSFKDKLSVSLWFRKDRGSISSGGNLQRIIGSSRATYTFDFAVYAPHNEHNHFWVHSNDKASGERWSLIDGQLETWHHIVYIIEKDRHRAYLDGQLVVDENEYVEVHDSNSPLIISYDDSDNYFRGAIDDVRIFDHVLSEKEVLDLFNDEYENSHDVQITSNVSKITSADKKLPYKVDITNLKSKNLKMWSTLKLPNGVNYAIHQAKKLKVKKGQSKVINGNLTLEKWFPVGEYKYTWYLANPKQKDGNIVLDSITFEKK